MAASGDEAIHESYLRFRRNTPVLVQAFALGYVAAASAGAGTAGTEPNKGAIN
jgi:ABC-type amino acid transport system permease subunit